MFQESEYMKASRRRLLAFVAFVSLYLLFMLFYLISSLFFNINIPENMVDNISISFNVFCALFNIYTYIKYYENSVESEKKAPSPEEWSEVQKIDRLMAEKYNLPPVNLEPFNHKKSRREMLLITIGVVALNGFFAYMTAWGGW